MGTTCPASLAEIIGKHSWSQWCYEQWHQGKVACNMKLGLIVLFSKELKRKTRESGYFHQVECGYILAPLDKVSTFKDKSKKNDEI